MRTSSIKIVGTCLLLLFGVATHAASPLTQSLGPLTIHRLLTNKIDFSTPNTGSLTLTGASSTIKHIEILFSDRADCNASTAPTTAYTMMAPIIHSTGLAFTAGQTLYFDASALYALIASTATDGSAPTSTQCMQVYLTDNSTNGASCLSYPSLSCDNTAKTCTTTATNSAAWVASPTACVPFLTASSLTGSSSGALNQGLTNRVFMKAATVSGGVAFQSSTIWLLSNASGGIAKSKDSGATWSNVPTGATGTFRSVSCTGPTCVAVGNNGNIRFSTVKGATWAPATGSGSVVSTNLLNSVSCSGSTCVAVGNAVSSVGTIAYSSDSGHSWTRSSSGVPTVNLNSVSCKSSTTCVAAGNSGTIVYSSDGGVSWSAAVGTLLTSNNYNGVSCIGSSCVAVGTNTTSVSSSTDSGQTWASVTTGITTGVLNDVGCTATYCVAVGTSTNRVIRSSTSDGTAWSTPTTSTLTASVSQLAVRCTGTICVAGSSTGAQIGYSSDSGNSWAVTATGLGTATINSTECTSNTCLAATNSLFYRSTDRGATWSAPAGMPTTTQQDITCSGATCLSVGNISAGAGSIFKSSNSGAAWSQKTLSTASQLNGVACNGSTCFAVGNTVSNQGFIGVSTNTGDTWTAVTTTNAGNNNLNAVSCASGTCVAVGEGGKAVYSTNLTTWAAGATPFSAAINDVACINSTTCIACDGAGRILRTTNSGATWSTVTTVANGQSLNGIACNATMCLIVGATGAQLISTNSGSTWTLLLPVMAVSNFTWNAASVF
jgi:photosystem II stability/assembly factor-like uncharacterized protein